MGDLEQSLEELEVVKQNFKSNFNSNDVATTNVEFRNYPNLMLQLEKKLPSQTKTITPSKESQSVKADNGYKLGIVNIDAIPSQYIEPSGTLLIQENGTFDVTNYANAEVDVNIVTPSGIKTITENGDYDVSNYAWASVNVEPNLITKEITENGTYKASDDGADGYSEVVVTVAGSGSGGGVVGRTHGEFRCVAVDYDGSVLKEEWLNEGDTFELPEFPTHDRLVGVEWVASEPIENNRIVVKEGVVVAGIIYDTKSGLTEFDFSLNKATGLTVNFNLSGTKDWGDGTTDTATSHTYADYGDYTMMYHGTSLYGNSAGATSVFGSGAQYQCVAVRMSKITFFGYNAFYNCYALKYVTFPKTITTWEGKEWFYGCVQLESMTFPSNVKLSLEGICRQCYALKYVIIPYSLAKSAFGQRFLLGCESLKILAIPDSIVTINSYSLADSIQLQNIKLSAKQTSVKGLGKSGMYNVLDKRIVIPNTITSSDSCYLGGNHDAILDFSKWDRVFNLSNTNFIGGTNANKQMKIVVPDDLYDEWIAATNWSTFANYIYKASEV